MKRFVYTHKNEDNAVFFTVVSEFYNNGSIDLNYFKEKYPHLMVFWETLVAIGAATNSKELIEYAQESKGEINMCTALDNMIREGKEEGLQEGRKEEREQGIYLSIKMLRENGVKEESILDSIMKNYEIPYDDMKELLEK